MTIEITFTLNGKTVTAAVEPRLSLADFLRDHMGLTATHLGCEHGVCGACTIQLEGAPARSCIMLAAECDGQSITTLEHLVDDPDMVILREAFHEKHGLQCGFCTPGFLISALDIIRRKPGLSPEEIRLELSGNLCRCTGYQGIVRAVQEADQRIHSRST